MTDIDKRPIEVDGSTAKARMSEFVKLEGKDVVRDALEDLSRVDPEAFDGLVRCLKRQRLSSIQARLLVRYGLADQDNDRIVLSASMIKAAVKSMIADGWVGTEPRREAAEGLQRTLTDEEWARELGALAERFNMLERRLRDLIRFTLRSQARGGPAWHELVRAALSDKRKGAVSGSSADQLMAELYFKELGQIVSRNWVHFQSIFGDRVRFEQIMERLNDRPHTHSKDVDLIYAQNYRDALAWLEDRVLS